MSKNKLTDRQHEVLDFICTFIIERSMSPTIREVGNGCGFNEKASHDHIRALERKGYIATQPGRPRSIRILKMASVYEGSVGDLFLQVAPEGTAKLDKVREPGSLRFEDVSICVG